MFYAIVQGKNVLFWNEMIPKWSCIFVWEYWLLELWSLLPGWVNKTSLQPMVILWGSLGNRRELGTIFYK